MKAPKGRDLTICRTRNAGVAALDLETNMAHGLLSTFLTTMRNKVRPGIPVKKP
ncbi:hypothetical protein NTG1052_520007 [Candidatus Nitrotoga sp. 1052]|nr:hypothetical protein NTG1052_520007 [Candidatus Nitrotoga sp. 1052]